MAEMITVEREKLEELLVHMLRKADCANDAVYTEKFIAILDPTPTMSEADWQRVIDDGFYVRDKFDLEFIWKAVQDDLKRGLSDIIKVVREKGIRQPHFKGHPHPEGRQLVEVYYDDNNTPGRMYAGNVLWKSVTEYIVL